MRIDTKENNQIQSWFKHHKNLRPEKTFIFSIDQKKKVSFNEAYKINCQISNFLKERKIKANDRIALLSNNSIEHLMTYLGVMSYGATVCTINIESNPTNINNILNRIAPRLILYEASLGLLNFETSIETLPLGFWQDQKTESFFKKLHYITDADIGLSLNNPEDIASIFFTSGTETKPKGVICSFEDLVRNTIAVVESFGIKKEDRILEFRSFNWMSAQVLSGLGSLCMGSTLLLARKFSVSQYFNWIKNFQATIATGNPTTINMLNNRPTSLSSDEIPHLRFMTSSSAPLLVEDWKRFEALYEIPISQGYGASECGWIAGSNEKNRRLGSVGRPLKYQNVKIIDNAGKCQPENIQGNIAINPSKNKEYLYLGEDGEIKTDGVGSLITGDIGYIDDDGFLFVTGREKDLIITGGVNVSPLEIENVLMELDSIVEAAAIGIKDQIYGEQVVAFVVLLDGVDEKREKILDHCQQKLAKMKIPRLIEFLDKLPKTTRGKLDRNKLKNIYSNLNQK
ncbi:MAG: class I adenylate-forming enzyme family protein [SAR324 cluster bacterium]|jgi:acyl-coenzyme A synthetase/AMP-(fatty) acid ligase|nr:hypothetical protein [Deltaproteobacteria bacterium]MDP6092851.1 class I adenylate-forming enzyme family protein [SAR324 cluster bacterium]MDP6464432.1 class I adenylate-forming enzyme family protein [SAR324 cluster bacterium]MDP7138509.1 class I adenylate-forming enzyme family protein [SAR324 cluster bacterium]MDP7331899.1 class I adenylate-forming enzyme family protein [SAR324 cluster bacterium]|tara:strand:- start:666 stop:2204 length:1539 start_codon:yes stop_codon:yes gene_type:complete